MSEGAKICATVTVQRESDMLKMKKKKESKKWNRGVSDSILDRYSMTQINCGNCVRYSQSASETRDQT